MKMALKDHMTRKLVTIDRDAPAFEALRLMSNFWIRHLPVVDQSGDVIGMLSERDLMSAADTATPVDKFMSAPLKVFDIDAPIKAVVDDMIEEKTSAFLITKKEEVVGIVTSEDMLILLNEILSKDQGIGWPLSYFFVNPIWQRTAYMVGQAGI